MHNGSPSTLVPVVSYVNADILKKEIVNDNKGKAGIYRRENLKSYIGSSVNLGVRLKRYYSYQNFIDPKRVQVAAVASDPWFNNLLTSTLSLGMRSVHTGSSSTVVPMKSYANADLNKLLIIQENTGKSGIYR